MFKFWIAFIYYLFIYFVDGKVANEIALAYKGIKIAVLSDGEIYCHRKEERVARTFGIMDKRHPVVDQIMQSGDWLLGGDIQVCCFFENSFFTILELSRETIFWRYLFIIELHWLLSHLLF